MYNAITQSRKVNKTLPTFQGYDPARYRKCKAEIAIPKEHCPSKEQENKRGLYITPLRHGRMRKWLNLDPTCEAAVREGRISVGKENLSWSMLKA